MKLLNERASKVPHAVLTGFSARFLAGFVAMVAIGLAVSESLAQTAALKLEFPLKCRLGADCFLQQLVDMDDGPGASDPFCGSATYDGHKGTDFRVLSMADLDRNVAVLAAAEGRVKAVRDGEADRLVSSSAMKQAVSGKECGNGIVLDHGSGIETQYCHMKKGSIRVSQGDTVSAGQPIGAVGASGLAQFPHLHVSLRIDGNTVDPFTGRMAGASCDAPARGGWWKDSQLAEQSGDAVVLAAGLAGSVPEHSRLVIDGPPRLAAKDDALTVGWLWLANLRRGDRVEMILEGPDGFRAASSGEPLDRNKADWSGYVGKRRVPQSGDYRFSARILRGEETVRTVSRDFVVQ